jgi:hypothetical protein
MLLVIPLLTIFLGYTTWTAFLRAEVNERKSFMANVDYVEGGSF